MDIARTVAEHRARIADWRREGRRVCLVPTMGALHDGHLGLIAAGRKAADRVAATIFVNPAQFGAGEDFAAYPRDEARDAALLERAGCDMLFAPSAAEMYPPGFAVEVRVKGLSDCLCGAARPGHMDGVAQVVAKLLNQAGADAAIFGEKDWQQLAIVRRMVRDLDIATEILACPTIREPDGLAMSSRNRYLDPEQRRVAPGLNRALVSTAARIAGGEPAEEACAAAARGLLKAGFDKVDYIEAREGETLAPVAVHDPETPTRVFGAARLGRARLIDNVEIAALPPTMRAVS